MQCVFRILVTLLSLSMQSQQLSQMARWTPMTTPRWGRQQLQQWRRTTMAAIIRPAVPAAGAARRSLSQERSGKGTAGDRRVEQPAVIWDCRQSCCETGDTSLHLEHGSPNRLNLQLNIVLPACDAELRPMLQICDMCLECSPPDGTDAVCEASAAHEGSGLGPYLD